MSTTLDDIQADAASLFEQTNTVLDSTDAEYQRRTKIINMYEKQWARARSYRWKELYTSATLTFTANVATVSMPTGFTQDGWAISSDGTLKIGNHYYQLIPTEQKPSNEESSDRVAWLYGNEQAGYTLEINPAPSESITYDLTYYTKNLATDSGGTDKVVMADSTDITKIPNPLYLTYKLVSTLFVTDDQGGKGQYFESLARDELVDMIGDANQGASGQSNVIPASFDNYPYIGEPWRYR